MIVKILEHTQKKYTTIAGIWKVFAILLEQCCHLDYQMIIRTLNLQKNEELENIQKEYQSRIQEMEATEKAVLESNKSIRIQLQQAQWELKKEVQLRGQIEEELRQRGSGHDEEVSMRLQFESKLNHMFAVVRDMDTKTGQLLENLKENEGLLEKRAQTLAAQTRKNIQLSQIKVQQQQEIRRLEQKIMHISNLHQQYQVRLQDSFERLYEANQRISQMNSKYNLALNQTAQKKVEIDDLQCEVQVFKTQVKKLELMVQETRSQREIYTSRLREVENNSRKEIDKFKHFQQEYVRIKEQERAKSVQIQEQNELVVRQEGKITQLEKRVQSLKIHLDSAVQNNLDYKSQLKLCQQRIQEMNKGRRTVEEHNNNLLLQIEQLESQIQGQKEQSLQLKKNGEQLRTKINEQQNEINAMNVKITSTEKQLETQKESLHKKVKSLDELLVNQKQVRQNWIKKYQQQQRINREKIRELNSLQDQFNDVQIKLSSTNSTLQEQRMQVQSLTEKIENQLVELLQLRSTQQQLTRKNTTFEALFSTIDKNHKTKVQELSQEIKNNKISHQLQVEQLKMANEETWQRARINLDLYEQYLGLYEDMVEQEAQTALKLQQAQQQLNIRTNEYQGQQMLTEDLLVVLHLVQQLKDEQTSKLKQLEIDYDQLKNTLENMKSQIPPQYRNSSNPFEIIQNKLQKLQQDMDYFVYLKSNLIHQQNQTDVQIQTTFKETQTQIKGSFFDRLKSQQNHSQNTNKLFDKVIKNPPKQEPQKTFLAGKLQQHPLRKRVTNQVIENPSPVRKQSSGSRHLQQEQDISIRSIYGKPQSSLEVRHPQFQRPEISRSELKQYNNEKTLSLTQREPSGIINNTVQSENSHSSRRKKLNSIDPIRRKHSDFQPFKSKIETFGVRTNQFEPINFPEPARKRSIENQLLSDSNYSSQKRILEFQSGKILFQTESPVKPTGRETGNTSRQKVELLKGPLPEIRRQERFRSPSNPVAYSPIHGQAPPSEIKRFIKQAHSRRKSEYIP